MIESIVFYLFSTILLASAVLVITARNPVHSVLFLILAFFNAAGLFVLLGAEFIGLILVIVYVGAVAVLFLFVVMMLDINFAELRQGAMQYVPLGVLIGGILLAELFFVFGAWSFAPAALDNRSEPRLEFGDFENTAILGQVLYDDYVLAFQGAGLILLVAMIGAIVLTHRTRAGVHRQDVGEQNARDPADVVMLKKVAPRTGI